MKLNLLFISLLLIAGNAAAAFRPYHAPLQPPQPRVLPPQRPAEAAAVTHITNNINNYGTIGAMPLTIDPLSTAAAAIAAQQQLAHAVTLHQYQLIQQQQQDFYKHYMDGQRLYWQTQMHPQGAQAPAAPYVAPTPLPQPRLPQQAKRQAAPMPLLPLAVPATDPLSERSAFTKFKSVSRSTPMNSSSSSSSSSSSASSSSSSSSSSAAALTPTLSAAQRARRAVAQAKKAAAAQIAKHQPSAQKHQYRSSGRVNASAAPDMPTTTSSSPRRSLRKRKGPDHDQDNDDDNGSSEENETDEATTDIDLTDTQTTTSSSSNGSATEPRPRERLFRYDGLKLKNKKGVVVAIIEKKKWKCTNPNCKNKPLSNTQQALDHDDKHNNIKSHPCPYTNCSEIFTFKPELKHHEKFVHNGTQLFCTPCDKKYGSDDGFNRHMLLKHGIDTSKRRKINKS